MIRNRLLCIIAILAVALFYIFFIDYFSYYLVYYVVGILLLSLVLFLPALFGVRQSLVLNAAFVKRKETFSFVWRFENRLYLPFIGVMGEIHCRNMMTGEETTQSMCTALIFRGAALTMPFTSAHCGMLELSVKKLRIYDILGLYTKKMARPAPAHILAAPDNMLLSEEIDLTNPMQAERKTASRTLSGGYDLREYRPGDALRNMHWKLSAKMDEMFVKEFSENRSGETYLLLEYSHDFDHMDALLAYAAAFAKQMIELRQIFFAVAVNAEGQAKEYRVETDNDFYDFLCTVLSCGLPQNAAQALAHYYDDLVQKRVFRASPAGIYDANRDAMLEGAYE